jgi:DNA-binding MarR family transcriptional regulator
MLTKGGIMHESHGLGFYVRVLHAQIDRHFNKGLEQYDITRTQFDVMRYLYRHKDARLKDLVNWMQVSSASVSGIVSRLAAKGYVTHDRSQEDRRSCHLNLTESGRRLLESMKSSARHSDESMLHSLSPQEKDELYRLLSKVLNELIKEESYD